MRRVATVVLAGLGLGLGLASACADDGVATPATSLPPAEASEPRDAPAVGDPLLARALASIEDGVVDPTLLESIAASDAPAHARAKRLLAAIADPAGDDRDALVEANDPDAPPLHAPPLDAMPVDPAPDSPGLREGVKPMPDDPPSAAAGADPIAEPSTAHDRPSVSSLALSTAKGGATLTIRSSSKLLVGSANQLASGVVHLVVDKASASAAVAATRPKIEGVAVTNVRKGQGTVQISLALEPGWSLGPIRAFAGGTRVHFVHSS